MCCGGAIRARGVLFARMIADSANLTTRLDCTSQIQRYSHLAFTGSNGKHYTRGEKERSANHCRKQPIPTHLPKKKANERQNGTIRQGMDSSVMNMGVFTRICFYVHVKKKKKNLLQQKMIFYKFITSSEKWNMSYLAEVGLVRVQTCDSNCESPQ